MTGRLLAAGIAGAPDGAQLDVCTTRKAIRWHASRLGDITDPYELPA
jgi:hypothetical protein